MAIGIATWITMTVLLFLIHPILGVLGGWFAALLIEALLASYREALLASYRAEQASVEGRSSTPK